MALTLKGLQGTVSDTDMATQLGAHHTASVRGPSDYLVTAVANARTVNVAAGIADSAFLKVTNDGAAAGNLQLAPPSSGGKWYAITLDRQWSPTNSATLRADDLNVSDSNGTVPTTIAAAVLNALLTLPNQPGTSGSTAGQRQILAVVYVRAADTTLTIFDCRVIRTGAGELSVPSLHALAVIQPQVLNGAIVSVTRFILTGAATHQYSSWQKVEGVMLPVGGSAIMVSGVGSINDVLTASDAVAALQAAYSAQISWYFGQRLRADVQGIELRWGSTLRDNRYWRVWECDWINFRTGEGGATPSPGTPFYCRVRMQGGLAYFEWNGQMQNTSADPVSFGLQALPANPFGRGNPSAGQPWGNAFFSAGGNAYPMTMDWASANTGEQNMRFNMMNSGGQTTQNVKGQSPVNQSGAVWYINAVWNPNN